MMAALRHLLALLVCLSLVPTAQALDLVVITNAKSGVDRLSRTEVINIFLGRYRQLPSGLAAEPLDLPAASAEKAWFYQRLVGKDLAEINAYWARLIFSGRTAPPSPTTGSEQMLELVSRKPTAIGYIERSKLDPRVQIVFELDP